MHKPMTMMTFNLRYPETKDGPDYWPKRVGRAAAAILDNRPLVVGTQEGYHSMLLDLEPYLDDYGWIGNGRFGGHENEHCAIFYNKLELEAAEHGQFWLSETPDKIASLSWDSMFPRICTWARFVRRDDGQSFYVYNTHLDHRSQEARDRGCRVILDRMNRQREADGAPAVLMGDFNSEPDNVTIRFLRGELELDCTRSELTDAYSLLAGDPGSSFHGFRGGEDGQPIDYIFATPEFVFESVRVDRSKKGDGYPSDHYPIVAVLNRIS